MQNLALTGLEAGESRSAAELLTAWPFGAEAWPDLEPQAAARAVLDGLGPADEVLALSHGGGWQWLAVLSPLDFDSRIFGRTLTRLMPLAHRTPWPGPEDLAQGKDFLDQVTSHCADRGIEGLVARVPVRDMLAAQALETAGFLLMDVSVEWQLQLDTLAQPGGQGGGVGGGIGGGGISGGIGVRTWRPDDEGALMDLAGQALCQLQGYSDRFAMDPRLRHACPEMYRRWLANSLSGDEADQVLVLDMEGEPVGFITLRLPPGGQGPGANCGQVVLNALAPDLRGKGLYHRLLRRGLLWLQKHGADFARVRTKLSQGAVIRAWAALGARQVNSDLTFHHWQQ